jgi:HEAT repeat protein/class 3 adenylate cyclase
MEKQPNHSFESHLAALLFADVKGYSTLSEHQLQRFFKLVLPEIARVVQDRDPFYVNSWGDAVVAAFDDTRPAATSALALRDLFAGFDWSGSELPQLTVRCALHAGHLYTGQDPFSGAGGIVGTQVVLAARVEPVILPGHVWATDTFVVLLQQHDHPEIAFDDLGERPLAKEWGAKKLYRIRRSNETPELPTLAERSSENEHRGGALAICLKLINLGTNQQRIEALDMLGKFDHPDALRSLVAAAKNPAFSHDARMMAIASLKELGNPMIVPDMLDILRDPEATSDISRAVITLLGALGDIRALDPLIDTATAAPATVPTRVAEQAVMALGFIDDSRAQDAIVKLVSSGELALSRMALSALGHSWARGVRSNIDATDALLSIAQSGSGPPEMRGAAIEVLMVMGAKPALQDAIAEIGTNTDDVPQVRRAALSYLSIFESQGAREALEQVADDLTDPLAGRALVLLVKGRELHEQATKALGKAI